MILPEFQRQQKEKALQEYYKDPIYCLTCGKMISVPDGKRPAQIREKKFCNQSCAAKYNNREYPKRKAVKSGDCKICGTILHYKKRPGYHYLHRQYCDLCLPSVIGNATRLAAIKQGKNGLPKPLYEMTKGELRQHQPTYHAFKVKLDQDSRKVYKRSGQPCICKVCGYSHHVQICHIREIKDFPDTSLISEINSILNLIALCPNHHWELDHGILKL